MNIAPCQNSGSLDLVEEPAWFCLRSHPKHEHIAAAHLAELEGVQVFNPRLRRRTLTRRGLAWVTESVFPGYVFARFTFESLLNRVRYTPAVSSVVRFGDRYATIPELVIEELRQQFGDNELRVLADDLMPGTEVTLTDRPFHGMQAIVLQALPAKERVQVLLQMLGRQTQIEVSMQSVIVERSPSRRVA